MACWTGHVDNVALLLNMGCDMNMIATRSHNYGKSPIFFAATRGREDVMNLLLDRGANVLIVNNKGQSVYSVAMSHFDKSGSLIRRIRETEEAVLRMDGANGIMPLFDDGGGGGCWIDYSKTHRDGNVYGDLDLRFLDRPLVEGDVVADGVVNPTTRESRRGNFARNNPNASQLQEEDEEKRGGGRKEGDECDETGRTFVVVVVVGRDPTRCMGGMLERRSIGVGSRESVGALLVVANDRRGRGGCEDQISLGGGGRRATRIPKGVAIIWIVCYY